MPPQKNSFLYYLYQQENYFPGIVEKRRLRTQKKQFS